jgi:hypothetical protein
MDRWIFDFRPGADHTVASPEFHHFRAAARTGFHFGGSAEQPEHILLEGQSEASRFGCQAVFQILG